jgi:hypothetical protein
MKTPHPDIRRVVEPEQLTGRKLAETVKKLVALAEKNNNKSILKLLGQVLPGSEVGSVPPPDFTALA